MFVLFDKDDTMVSIKCLSVLGGWQTCITNTEITFGPVFKKIQDLHAWQRENLWK